MPPKKWNRRVQDILESIAKILRYTHGIDFERFCGEEMMLDAVIRNFAIIGEAARHIPAHIEQRYSEIPWARMRGMRNFVVHQYSGIDERIIWDTIQDDLPPLVPVLERILKENR